MVAYLEESLSALVISETPTYNLSKKARKTIRIRETIEHFAGRTELDIMQEMVKNFNLSDTTPQSKTACRKLLQQTFIHIFDYVKGDYHMVCDGRQELRKRIRQIGSFPSAKAKDENLRALLKTL